MSQAKGFSLWLIPSGGVHARLQRVVSQLSERYHTPSFEPHVTLLGLIVCSERAVASKTRELSSVVRTFRVALHNVDFRD